MPERVATCFLRASGKLLLCRSGDEPWNGPSARVTESDDPEEAARRLVREWTGSPEGATLVRAGEPVTEGARVVHPYLFDCESPVRTDEAVETVWTHATGIRRRETAIGCWRAYEAVAPGVESVRNDRAHGSAYVSVRALEVLRDRAGSGERWSTLVECATSLLAARPSMAALENRVNRAMNAASETASADTLEDAARKGIDRAVDADDRAGTRAAEHVEGCVLTLSRSGTVERALRSGEPDRVVVLESRPDREGHEVAEDLAGTLDVTLTLDAAVSHLVCELDCVIVGADTVLADGSVVNKVGTRTTAVAAAREDVPVYAVAAADKISSSEEPILESVASGSIHGGESVAFDCPLFDRTPPDLVTDVITERGVLDTSAIRVRAKEHGRLTEWQGTNDATA